MSAANRWRWIDGFYLPPPGRELLGFIPKILKNPLDDVTRVVLADRIQQTELEGSENCAKRLRLEGLWSIGGSVGRRHFGLTWWPDGRLYEHETSGSVIAYVSRPKMPYCAACRSRQIYSESKVLHPIEKGWHCFDCYWELVAGE